MIILLAEECHKRNFWSLFTEGPWNSVFYTCGKVQAQFQSIMCQLYIRNKNGHKNFSSLCMFTTIKINVVQIVRIRPSIPNLKEAICHTQRHFPTPTPPTWNATFPVFSPAVSPWSKLEALEKLKQTGNRVSIKYLQSIYFSSRAVF